MTYTVHRNHDGDWLDTQTFDDLDAAVAHASRLARATIQTIRARMKRRKWTSCGIQVAGPEIGRDGVWIEKAIR
jgi:hypothetical protein